MRGSGAVFDFTSDVGSLVARRRAAVHAVPARGWVERVGGHAGGDGLQDEGAVGHQRVVVQVGSLQRPT
jgi:hypothetical protein